MALLDRLKHSWSVFTNSENYQPPINEYSLYSTGSRPDRKHLTITNERSIIASVYNQIAIDVSAISLRHARFDKNGRYLDDIKSGLNEVLTLSANLDQTGRQLIQDAVLSMFDEGCIALVPTETDISPTTGSFDIRSMRVGEILAWYPDSVRLRVYNEKTGKKQEVVCKKSTVAIIENPLYAIMNEPNSTLKRLVRKLNLLDAIDEQSGSGKLDIIIQLPYTIKSETRKQQAEERRKSIEMQLAGSKYGIAYIDAAEHVTQLNRASENNLLNQVTYLTEMLYSQLGLTEEIFKGTADEQVLLNYYNRTVEPILSAFADEMKRKFLTKTARTQRQSIYYFRDPFKLIPTKDVAEIADKFTRNEILSSNEVRSLIGFKPSDDPRANELRNKNLNRQAGDIPMESPIYSDSEYAPENQNGNSLMDTPIDDV